MKTILFSTSFRVLADETDRTKNRQNCLGLILLQIQLPYCLIYVDGPILP